VEETVRFERVPTLRMQKRDRSEPYFRGSSDAAARVSWIRGSTGEIDTPPRSGKTGVSSRCSFWLQVIVVSESATMFPPAGAAPQSSMLGLQACPRWL
jgi:hypothetical protein